LAKSVSNKKSFTFVAGLNTEAGPLTFPPNTWADGINIIPDVDGSLVKRPSINYENAYALSAKLTGPVAEETGAFVCGEWNSAGGNGAYNFVVVQRADKLYIYTNSGDGISPTEQPLVEILLATYKVPGNPNASGVAPCSFSNANGRLLVTSADTYPLLLTYTVSTGIFSASVVTIYFRDVYGVTDGLAVNNQPATLSNEHKYNLYNQGWTDTNINSYFASQAKYPSNAQVWTAGKDASDNFDPTLLVKQDFGTTPAAKGRFVLNLFYRDRDSAAGIAAGLVSSELYYPTTCTFYAGRAWYAGMKGSDISTWVLFSQVADDNTKFGYCYQEADPTSEFISDLVDTDGGVIPIQDAGNIICLKSAYNSLLVFAENGVWQISGGLDQGFSATSYEVKKLSSAGCVGAQTVVEAENNVFFWSQDGIWRISPTDTGTLKVENITNLTIHTLYAAIPVSGRTYASSRYHLEGKCVYWLYNDDDEQDGVSRRYKKNKMLVLDLRLPAFYVHSISSLSPTTPYITDLCITKTRQSLSSDYDVADSSGSLVVDGSGNQVVATLIPAVLRNTDVRFMTVVPSGANFTLTFSSFDDGIQTTHKFKDWYTYDSVGTTYACYLLTGHDLGNNQGGDRHIQGLYITCFFRRTETGVDSLGNPIGASSCTLQTRWDWTDASIAGKWSAGEEVYRHRRAFFPDVPSVSYGDGYPVVTSKSKVRGRGRSVQLLFTAAAEMDMQLLGWAITYIGNQNV
jgi:hypothetical protein